ncbi:adenylate/guanylate cyclase domain-containing protein [uncultured Roseobacter sp.]|uniref:CHASE2 domain-containing protein n=1 Tax=uncultured Roseobacter sp. TaxID=114847 RepID=UPI00262C5493|nr:adenylate/guanylate cyclase domain-containing protein [uncultured Roseobacter sp.]
MKTASASPLWTGVIALGMAALWVYWISLPHISGTSSRLDGLEAVLLDYRFALTGPVDPAGEVIIVAIDNATIEGTRDTAAEGRLLLAKVIESVSAAEPKVVGLDVILADAGAPETHNKLAAALASVPTVIASAGSFSQANAPWEIVTPDTVLRPQSIFASAAMTGLVNVSTDASGTPRHMPVVFLTDQGIEPSLPLRVAALFAGAEPRVSEDAVTLAGAVIPLDLGMQMPLRLVGPERTLPTLSALDVLAGSQDARLRGKAVIIGYTATAFGDRFPTAFGDDTPGVEVIATAVSQLLGGETLLRDMTTRWADVAASIGLALICTVLVLSLPLSTGIPLALGVLGAYMAVVWFAFSNGIWLSAAVPLASAGLPIIAGSALRYFREKRKASHGARALAALKQFQSPALAEMISENPAFLKEPTPMILSVFFVDLSGFTQLSEALGPANTQDFLKRFHQVIANRVEEHDGIVLNYMGDGALAVFGMTDAVKPSADNALQAGFELVDDVRGLGRAVVGTPVLGCRVGIHRGEVVLSRLGGERHQQVSVAGDTVNLASRLMEVAKSESAVIAATEELMQGLGTPASQPSSDVKPVKVRGRQEEAQVHLWHNVQNLSC